MTAPFFTQNLLHWNKHQNKRQMPWKGEPDPYRIWLSEVILQQTRVEQGWSYYERFLKKFPDIQSLSSASDEIIYKMWEGLGYYSRCRNLIKTARLLSSNYNGLFPRTYNELLKLPGIGPYTAAAIASFAFNEKHAVVDGNVHRVIARCFGISTPINTPEGKKLFSSMANSLIDAEKPAVYNQAIMDFGATICKPRNPLCESCVQSADCEALRHGRVNDLPIKEKKMKRKTRWLYYFIVEKENSVYIRKRQTKDIWQNLHEFVLFESQTENNSDVTQFLERLLQHQSYTIVSSSEMHSQHLTHQHIKGRFFRIQLKGDSSLEGGYSLVKKSNLDEYAFPGFINSFLEKSPI
jgi:A/G-specific adenine glycosylase